MIVKEIKTKYPGVRLRNNWIWIDFKYKGVRCREPVGLSASAKNIEAANMRRNAILYDIFMQRFDYSDYFPNSSKVIVFGGASNINITVENAVNWWFNLNAPKDSNSKGKMESDIIRHIIPGLGNILLNELKASHVKEWIGKKELSASTKNNILTPLRALFVEALSEGMVEQDIMALVPSFKRHKKNKNPLSYSEVDRVLTAFETEEARCFYQVALFSGLSTGEQAGLKWGDINFDKKIISVQRILTSKNEIKKTKNSFRERHIEFLNPVYEALLYLAPDDYFLNSSYYSNQFIFIDPSTNKSWTNHKTGIVWKNALKKSGIPHRSPYETRHTFASIMVTACLPDAWIRQTMGHATMRMLENVYGKWLNDAHEVTAWLRKKTEGGVNGYQFTQLFLKE